MCRKFSYWCNAGKCQKCAGRVSKMKIINSEKTSIDILRKENFIFSDCECVCHKN